MMFAGFGASAVGLALKYWKYIAIILVIVAIYFIVKGKINDMKEEAFNNGVTAERGRWEERIRLEDKSNREFEAKVQGQIDDLGARLQSKSDARIKRSTVHTTSIREIIMDNPIMQDCKVPEELLEQRNAIRRMGPEKKEEAK